MTAPTRLNDLPPSFSGSIGVARRDITPPVGIYARQWGAAKHDVAEGIHRPLSTTVLVFQQLLDAPLVLVSLDAGWFRGVEGEWLIRGHLLEELKLDPARVMVNVTHTHAACGISLVDHEKPGGEMIRPYLELIRDRVADAVAEALAQAKPATLTFATGSCSLAANRDLPHPEMPTRRVVCGFNPGGGGDDTLLVGRITSDSDNRVMATIVNYACHPTTLAWENRQISPDFVGAAREVIERHTHNAPCVFLQGASGELAPRWQYVGNTAVADRHGRYLGFCSVATLESMLPPRQGLAYDGVVESGAPLAMWRPISFEPPGQVDAARIEVPLPLRKLPTMAEIEAQLATTTDRTIVERLRRKREVVRQVGSGPTCPLPAWIWRIGSVLVVGQPNEAYSDFQIELRRRFPDYALVVMNLVNGSCGYLCPPEKYDGPDIYQVWQSPFDRQALPTLMHSCSQAIDHLLAQ